MAQGVGECLSIGSLYHNCIARSVATCQSILGVVIEVGS